ncbi:hypothetical protein BD413DRAFT_575209, partial [Trametes elegans]
MLWIDEADLVLFADESDAPPEGGATSDLEERMSVPGWLGSGNRIYTGCAVENGSLPSLTFRLPEMLHAVGSGVVDTRRVPAPIRSAWHKCSCVSADVANKFAEFSVVNVSFVFAHLSAALFAMGKLRRADDTVIAISEGMEETVHEIREAFGRDGAFIFGRYCVWVKRD